MGLLDNIKKGIADTSQKVSNAVKEFKVEDITSNLKVYEKYFSESNLWEKIGKVGKTIGATILYPVLLLFNLFKSNDVNLKEKTMIIGTLGYFILPVDLLPDALVGVGYTDDIAALTATLTALASCLNADMQSASKQQLKNMLGEYDERAVDSVSEIISQANKAINK